VEDWTQNYFTESLRKDERAKSEISLQIITLSVAPDMKVSLIPPLYFPFVYSSPVNNFSLLLFVCESLRLQEFRTFCCSYTLKITADRLQKAKRVIACE
jgi:hypothetical protein